MSDLQGKQLKNTYDNLVTRGTNGEIENGLGNPIPVIHNESYSYGRFLNVPSGEDLVITIPDQTSFLLSVTQAGSVRSIIIGGWRSTGSVTITDTLLNVVFSASVSNNNIIVTGTASRNITVRVITSNNDGITLSSQP